MKLPKFHPVFILAVKIGVSCLILWWVLTSIDLKAVLLSFRHADVSLLALGIVLSAVQLFLHILRWRFMVRIIDPAITLRESALSFFVGSTAGFATPGQVGEFFGRIASHPTVERSRIIGISLIEKYYVVAITFVLGGIGSLAFVSRMYPELWHDYYRYAGTFLFGIVIALLLYPSTITAMLQLLPATVREHRFYRMIGLMETLFTDRNARISFAYTLIVYTVIYIENYVLLNAFGPVDYETAFIGTGAVLFFKAFVIPISFSDIGVREGASVFFFNGLGIGTEIAFNTSVLVTVFNIIIPSLIGAILTPSVLRRRS